MGAMGGGGVGGRRRAPIRANTTSQYIALNCIEAAKLLSHREKVSLYVLLSSNGEVNVCLKKVVCYCL